MIQSAEEFVRLRSSGNPAEYLRAATDEAPIEVWREVISNHHEMRSWVAHNKTVPLEILVILARDPSPEVRHTVATKNRLPAELMLEVACDTDQAVRQRIAHNKNAPADVLRKLAQDESPDIAAIAARRLAALT
jgi:hypothetical protein